MGFSTTQAVFFDPGGAGACAIRRAVGVMARRYDGPVMPTITINGQKFEFTPGQTILQIA